MPNSLEKATRSQAGLLALMWPADQHFRAMMARSDYCELNPTARALLRKGFITLGGHEDGNVHYKTKTALESIHITVLGFRALSEFLKDYPGEGKSYAS